MQAKVVLITGGSSGIGKSIGMYLKSKGFKVYGTTRELTKHSDFNDFTLLQLDVRNPESAQTVIKQLLEKESRIDVLINNAGIGITGPLEETPHDEILAAFETNLHGPLHMIKAVLPHMRGQRNGLIINITSIAGYMGLPYRGIYSATKGALALITEAFRMETQNFGVQMTTLAPGDYATNIASGRYHTPITKESPYENPYSHTLHLIDRDVDQASDPIEVAKKVYKIIRTKNPKVHYQVGAFVQRFSIFLKRVLPDKIYEKLLLNHYKL
jgi:short-subunit dehydrogenase